MKKLTSVITLICIIISLFSFTASAAKPLGDVDNEDFGVLDALGVINADTWSDNSVPTRAEFIKLCVNLTGCGEITVVNKEPVFTDLTVNHWAYDAIMYAYSMGYISPSSDGRIRAESPITYGDAMRILVNFLGYQIVAASYDKGDVTQAYLKTASEIGLLDGVIADGIERPISKAAAVRMAYNALNVELPVQYFSNNNVFFNVQNDRTLLRVKFNAYKKKGVLRADDYTSLSHNLAKENYVTIDNENYFSANMDIEGLLGLTVEFYYTQSKDSEEKELIYISPSGNEIVEISADNLKGYSNMKVNTVTDSGKSVSYSIGKDSTVIWNNKIVKSAQYGEKFKIKSGNAKLIDNDEDGVYEVVILESLKAGKIVVNNTKDMVLALEDGTEYKFDDYKNYRIENGYGDKIDALSLHVDDIVTVVDPESTNHTLVIRVCTKNDTMVVGSLDADGYVLTGDGRELKYSKVAISDFNEVLIGDSYIFYTDKYGEIVYEIHVRSNQLEMAYIVNYKEQTGLDSNLVLRVMRIDGGITNVDCAKNVKIRDKEGVFSTKNTSGVITLLNQGGTTPKRQPVLIRTNASGYVCEIYMLATQAHPELPFHEIAYNNVGGSGKRWYQPAYTFHNVIQIKSSTPVFAVPHSTRTDVDEEEFFISNYRLFKGTVYYPESGENAYYQIPIGMEKGAIAADYFVWEYPENAEARTNYLNTTYKGVITKISQIIDENGEEYSKITYATTAGMFGNTVLYRQTNGNLNVIDNNGRIVNVGDVVSIGIDYFGHANEGSVKTFYDFKNDLIINEGDSSSPAFYAWRAVKGTIKEKDGDYIRVEIVRPSGAIQHQVLNLASTITINCDVDNKLFVKDRAPSSLLAEDDEFFLVISGALPVALLVYE